VRRLLACLAAAAFLAAGCGGDDEEAELNEDLTTPASTETTGKTETAKTETTKTETAATETTPATAPETQPGGAGDEEPIRTEVMLTGRDGRIRPARVRVPPYIGVRVELRAADEGTYTLKVRGRTIRAGGSVSAASTTIDGMKPGQRVVATPVGGGNRVVIEASAEPGP
jgi:hypothetical protein